MSRISELKRRFREASEHHLRVAAMEEMRARYPDDPRTRRPAYRSGILWRRVFVPAYRRIPWTTKSTIMRRSGMVASGWTPPSRTPGTPWTPPRPPEPGDR